MKTAIEVAGYCVALPACVSMAFIFLARKFLPGDLFQRYAVSVGVTIAFFISYALLSWTELSPNRHWHWLPYLGLIALVMGPVSLAAGIRRAERWLIQLVLAILAAWLLVPDWSTLQPPRPTYIVILAGYLFLVMALLDLLPNHLAGPRLLVYLGSISLFVSLAIAMSVSLKYGQLAAVVTSALAGCWVSSFFLARDASYHSIIPLFVILVGGLGYVGAIEPERPLIEILAIPAAPLMLWPFAIRRLSILGSIPATVAQTSAVHLLPLIVLIRLAW